MHFLHNEVSSEAIQGYLRQGTQIEQVWQQIDEQVAALTLGGMAPWDVYNKMGYALAFVRACRLNVVLVQKLLEGADPTNSGYVPRSIYDQAQALGELFEPYLEEAIRLLDPHYATRQRIPLALRRVPYTGRYSASHLLGVMAAGRETREWAAGLLAQYEVAVQAPKIPLPQPVAAHLDAMKNQLALGDFHLESGTNLIGGVRNGQQVADELCVQGDNLFWEAMESFYRISQLVAYPGAWNQPAPGPSPSPPPAQHASGVAPVTPPPDRRARTSAQVSDLLGQLGQERSSGRLAPSSPGASDLLKDLQMKTASDESTRPAPDTSTLLDQLELTAPPPAKPSAGAAHVNTREPNQAQAPTEKKVADLLSDLNGEHTDQK